MSTDLSVRYIAIDDNLLDLLSTFRIRESFSFSGKLRHLFQCAGGSEAQQYIKSDFMFLDIEIPNVSGLDLFRKICQDVPIVVLILRIRNLRWMDTGISFMASTTLKVCKTKCFYNHKIFRNLDERGKFSMGWTERPRFAGLSSTWFAKKRENYFLSID